MVSDTPNIASLDTVPAASSIVTSPLSSDAVLVLFFTIAAMSICPKKARWSENPGGIEKGSGLGIICYST
jgi:hypothetical protein